MNKIGALKINITRSQTIDIQVLTHETSSSSNDAARVGVTRDERKLEKGN